jgi:hypothetical protein
MDITPADPHSAAKIKVDQQHITTADNEPSSAH